MEQQEIVENQHLAVLFQFLGAFEIRRVAGLDLATDTVQQPISLNMAKKIFLLLRKLFSPSSKPSWRRAIAKLLEDSMIESCSTLLDMIKQSQNSSFSIFLSDYTDSLKRMLASLTLLCNYCVFF